MIKHADLIRELVKTSAMVDERGHTEIADALIKCAQKIDDDSVPYQEVVPIFGDILEKEGFADEAKLLKEAQGVYDLQMSDVAEGIKQIGPFLDSLLERIQDKSTNLINSGGAKGVIQQLGKLWTSLNKMKSKIMPQLEQFNMQAKTVEDAMQLLTPGSVQVDGKPVPIEFVPDPDSPGWEMGVAFANGKWHEVQEDQAGKRSLLPIPEENVASVIPAELQKKYTGPVVEAPVEQTAPQAPPAPESVQQGVGAGQEVSTQQQQRSRDYDKFKPETLQSWIAATQTKLDKMKAEPDFARSDIDIRALEEHLQGMQEALAYKQKAAAGKCFNLRRYARYMGR